MWKIFNTNNGCLGLDKDFEVASIGSDVNLNPRRDKTRVLNDQ